MEESNLDLSKFAVTEKDFVMVQTMSMLREARLRRPQFTELRLFCFAKEVSEDDFKEIVEKASNAKHYGTEVGQLKKWSGIRIVFLLFLCSLLKLKTSQIWRVMHCDMQKYIILTKTKF